MVLASVVVSLLLQNADAIGSDRNRVFVGAGLREELGLGPLASDRPGRLLRLRRPGASSSPSRLGKPGDKARLWLVCGLTSENVGVISGWPIASRSLVMALAGIIGRGGWPVDPRPSGL